MMKKTLAVFMVAVFLLTIAVPLASNTEDTDAAGNTIIIESSPDFAPYDYYYGTEFAGIDMDILRAISNDIGKKIEFRPNDFGSILTSVTQHKCDMGASGFTITEERKESVLFTDDYALIRQVVVAKAGLDIKTIDDIRGKTIAAQNGTSGADYAEGVTSNLRLHSGYAQVVLDILNGVAFCEVVDDAVGMAQVSAYPDQLAIYDVLTDAEDEHYGFIFAKDNVALYNEFNESLKRLKADGTVGKIVQYYVDNNYSPNTPSYFNQVKTLFVLTPEDSPYTYKAQGRNAGIDVDILSAVAKEMDYRISFIPSKRVDFVDKITFTPSYIGADVTISSDVPEGTMFVPSGVTDSLTVVTRSGTSVDDLAGKNVAVLSFSAASEYMVGKGASEVREYVLATDAVTDLLNETRDCIVVDTTMAKSLSARYPGMLSMSEPVTADDYVKRGYMLSADAGDLADAVSAALTKVKDSGEVKNILDYYAGDSFDMTQSSYYYSEPNGFFEKLYDKFMKDFIDNDGYKHILTGLGNTVKITLIALCIGTVIGILAAAIMSIHAETGKLLIPHMICRFYVTIIRGTPVLVQLLIIYYVILVDFASNAILIAAIAFGLNSGAYVSEIVRSGINSVPKGQMEAARSLGLSTRQSMTSVVIPQAIRNILPALGNEGISLLKETSVAGYIAIVDLTKAADIIRMNTYDALLPLLVIAVIYLAMVLVLQFLIKKLERRLNSAY
ncbi:MAG: ABC transporter permease subunit [archaeon]|nr:ABC transporter permease subunit [archaeon]